MVACAKVIVFSWLFCCFLLVGQKHYKIGFFDDFEMLIFSFFGQKSRVNNLAMVESITWPSFWPKFCPERWPSYWLYFFHTFLLKLVFFSKISFSLQKEEDFWKTNKHNKKQKKTDGQVIDPSLGVFGSYYLVQVGFLEVIIWSKFVFLAYKNSGFKRFVLHIQLSFCVFFLSPILWQFSENSLFQKKGAKIGFSNFQCFKFRFSKFSFFRFAKTL